MSFRCLELDRRDLEISRASFESKTSMTQTSPPAPPISSETRATVDSSSVLSRSIAELGRQSRRLSVARLVVFLVAILGFVVLENFGWVVAVACTLVFFFLFVLHGRVDSERQRLKDHLLLNGEAEARAENRCFDHPAPSIPQDALPLEEGRRVYADEPETFALDSGVIDDLQVSEGRHTLFGFLDVSSTVFGAWRLRRLLTRPMMDAAAIRSRQAAVQELADRPESRQKILETLVALRRHSFSTLPKILRAPGSCAGRVGLLVIAHILGTIPLVLLVAAFYWTPATAFLVFLLVFNYVLTGMEASKSNAARDRITTLGPALRGILALEGAMDRAKFEADEWCGLKAVFKRVHVAARTLCRYQALLQFHTFGLFFEFFNVFTLWELRILPLAESALLRYRGEIECALGALGETEALLSLSSPLVEQSLYSMPELVESESPLVEAQGLGHPLLHSGAVVRNHLKLDGDQNVWIVTGSNMAGKSTYLKSVATNILLAGAGAPVCAQEFRWTPVGLYSDINIRDSLDDGKSYFRVEVERILQVIRAASRGEKVFAVFDELFRGTNSLERLAISRAILRHLAPSGALLVVATHDVALTELVTREGEIRMANYHFREQVKDGVMSFDYRLREGPAVTRNAIRVLEAVGYPREVTSAARAETDQVYEGRPETAD